MAKAAVGLQPRPITPAGFAHAASGGAWKMARHLDLINRRLVEMAAMRYRGVESRTIIACPPRHGKSMIVSQYFPAWWLGTFPDDRIILTGYEATFAADWGAKARAALEETGSKMFGVTVDPDVSASGRWNVRGHLGGMISVGAGGGLMGRGANLLIIDDPVSGSEDASSPTQREKIWDWWNSTVKTRLEPGAAVLLIMQRWHEDDLAGRLIAAMNEGHGEKWDVMEMKAIAEEGEPDLLGRQPGEALWPERVPIGKLLEMKSANAYWFAAQFQQNPRPKGGAIFKREWLKDKFVKADAVPKDAERCRFWDKAASEGKGDYTASCLMARSAEGRYYVEHVTRDRLSPHGRDRKIAEVARDDERRGPVRIRSDQDPGSAGKAEAEFFRGMLEAYDVKTAPVTGNKETGFRPFASAAEGGNVLVVKAPWNDPWLDELESFTGKNDKHDDMVDSTGGAYRELAGRDDTLRVGENFLRGYRGRVSVA